MRNPESEWPHRRSEPLCAVRAAYLKPGIDVPGLERYRALVTPRRNASAIARKVRGSRRGFAVLKRFLNDDAVGLCNWASRPTTSGHSRLLLICSGHVRALPEVGEALGSRKRVGASGSWFSNSRV
jgi:hypothetical protein